jgi:hypothetical protein
MMVPDTTKTYMSKQFTILHQTRCIALLSSTLTFSPGLNNLQHSVEDHTQFLELKRGHSEFVAAMRLFAKRRNADEAEN